jgi:HAD superfamily hydrolase (TIGR01549 family)
MISLDNSKLLEPHQSDRPDVMVDMVTYVHHLIDHQKIKAVIFDVDGTLYSLKKLYARMYRELFKYYLMHPHKTLDLWILHNFIQAREHNAATVTPDLEKAQYEWAVQASRMPLAQVQPVVQQWIFETPLKYLYDCRYPEIIQLFGGLADRGIPTAIFSDYPAQAKLACLGLSSSCIVSSTDKNVNCLKPDPTGLQVVVEKLGLAMQDCLFIGDRDDRDGECARKVGMSYLILDSSASRLKWANQ